eukprot:g6072.t1
MRRRGPCVHGLQRRQVAAKKLEEKGAELEDLKMQHVSEQLTMFKSSLEEFAKKYKNDIKKDPKFRQQFQVMCSKIGVDPLASSKGFWADILGVGDFYYEIGVQIVDVCLATREANGGLIDMDDLRLRLRRMRGSNAVDLGEDDVRRAVGKLKNLGQGFDIQEVGGRKMVVSVPRELNQDHVNLMHLAGQHNGAVSGGALRRELGWDGERTARAIKFMCAEGMCWIDDQAVAGDRHFWFPSMWKADPGSSGGGGEGKAA